MTIRPRAAVAFGFFLWIVPLVARAQFESPSRAFHNATGFRLEGKHLAVPCESCHLNGQYKGTPNTCFDCHWIRRQDDRFRTGLGAQCDQCHRPTGWTDVKWNHASATGMPLNADHRELACVSCHRDGSFRSASVACASCHQKDYNGTTAPNHAAAGFPTTCDACHRPGDLTWHALGGAGFNHDAVFPLMGVHATQACATCHRSSVYKGTPRDCAGCHLADYNRTANPNHAAAGFPTTCDGCHKATDPQWAGAGGGFNHAAVFPLVGVHATQACGTCHRNSVYKGTPRDCVGCHQADYNRTTSPSHAAAGFPTTCDNCHKASDPQWKGTSFNHNAAFPLIGVHATQACATCHKNNVYKGTPRDCAGCHQADYNRTTSPNHAAAGFPTSCDSCHKASDPQWKGAGFNHGAFFPLVGVHATQACAACHRNNVYKGTPRDCAGCHLADYNRTANPNHTAAGFPTTCTSCHNATDGSWQQGRFAHTAFPLTGRHSVPCQQCHTTPSNYKLFSCTVCHDRTSTDSKHRGVTAYRYDSVACYSCHPTGRGN